MKKKLTSKNPFIVPKGYLDSFEDGLKDRLIKEKSPIPKEEGFVVPSTYFEDLHSNLLARMAKEEDAPKVIPLNPIRKWMAIAASIAAITILSLSIDWGNEGELNFTDLANSEIEAYFEDTELDLSTDEIAEVLPIEAYEIHDFVEPKMNEENLLDYLNENVEDFEELNLENNE